MAVHMKEQVGDVLVVMKDKGWDYKVTVKRGKDRPQEIYESGCYYLAEDKFHSEVEAQKRKLRQQGKEKSA